MLLVILPIILLIQMQKPQKAQTHTRCPSHQFKKTQPRAYSRQNSATEGEQSHMLELKDLKEKGKKVLKKLIPNQPITLIKKLVQMGADNIKKQILPYQKLLPVLTTTKIRQQLLQHPQVNPFQQKNVQLTNSLLFFQKKVHSNLQNTQLGEIVRAQIEKCHQRIPQTYFQSEIHPNTLNTLLTRDRHKSLTLREELTDHYDQVEFNVNQQVTYKMGIFVNFVTFLTSIGQLADLSIDKIKGTRSNNHVVKEIVIQRSQRVNALRRRKEEIQRFISTLQKIKKLKKLQNWFMSQVQSKGKITSLSHYEQYCQLHNAVKSYCCTKLLCKFWDIAYYIERGYQDSFCRSLKNYLGEIITLDQKQIQEIITPSKHLFATVTDARMNSLKITSLNDPTITLDESFQVDQEEVQLVSKHNIERQIVSSFQQGLNKCSYSTDQICTQLKTALTICQGQLYMLIRGQNPTLTPKPLTCTTKKEALDKLIITKYIRIVEQWSERMKRIVKRQLAILQKALKATFHLQKQSPQKYEVICSYLMQILYITFASIDESMSHLITCRKFKQTEADSIRQLLLYQQQWKELIINIKHSHIWKHFQQRFVQEQHQERSNVEIVIVAGLLGNLTASRRKIVEIMINGYNASAIESLPLRLQEQDWKTISIPSRFYKMLGQVIYGRSFTKDLEKEEIKMLSSSLLLIDKNSSFSFSHRQSQSDKSQIMTASQLPNIYPIQVTQSLIKIQDKKFKMINSTISVIEAIQGYLEWVDEAGEGQKLQSTILSKIMQYIMMYNTHIKELILNKAALNYGKIKSKSITGKHLLIAYSQLKLFKTLTLMIAKRYPNFQPLSDIITDRLHKNSSDISKKFRSILQLSIRQSINKLVVDPRKEITWPVQQSTEIAAALNRSCEYVRDILLSDSEMPEFISVVWCNLYLQKLCNQYKSVYRQIMNSNGTRKSKDIDWSDNLYWKFKELQYMVQNLTDIQDHLPHFNTIIQELALERNKLERPH